MKTPRPLKNIWLLIAFFLPAFVRAQSSSTNADGIWNYTLNNGSITITGYAGSRNDLTVPSSLTITTNLILGGGHVLPFEGTFPVNSIGDWGLSNHRNITNINIPNSIVSIGSYAFNSCTRLTDVMIPNSVTNIGTAPFEFCTNLTAIFVHSNNPAFSSVSGALFDKNQTTLIEIPSGITGHYTIPDTVTGFADLAFSFCQNLRSITIGPYITNLPIVPFGNCVSLESIIVESNNPAFSSVAGVLFDKSQTTIIECPRSFSGNYIIPISVTNIGNWAFYLCAGINGFYFQTNAPILGDAVFNYDFSATAYYLPGTKGWDSNYGGIPTALWLPQMQTSDGNFGIKTNRFGFNINWASGQTVVIETCTNLANPVWQPEQTNYLSSGSTNFSDPQWTNYPQRYYRLRSP